MAKTGIKMTSSVVGESQMCQCPQEHWLKYQMVFDPLCQAVLGSGLDLSKSGLSQL